MTGEYGELMQTLMSKRAGFADDAQFRRFAVETTRTFIHDLRVLGIEVSMRPEFLADRTPTAERPVVRSASSS